MLFLQVGFHYIRTNDVVYYLANTKVGFNNFVTLFPIMLCSPQTKNRQNMTDETFLIVLYCKENFDYKFSKSKM